jgi:NADH-quinone oxidoreductase subunit C
VTPTSGDNSNIEKDADGNDQTVEMPLLDIERFPNVRRSVVRNADLTPTFVVPAGELISVLTYLRDELDFKLFEDITAVDWLPREPRFEVVYNLLSITNRQPIRLKVELPGENPKVASATDVYKGANWYEREVYDLFGITFEGHPELRRIEMPDDWYGHPLRKDYPTTGPRRPNLPANQFRPEGRSGPTQN